MTGTAFSTRTVRYRTPAPVPRKLGRGELSPSRALCTAATPVTERATARFPSADVLVDYMADFAKPQEQDGHISYSTDVRCTMLSRAYVRNRSSG